MTLPDGNAQWRELQMGATNDTGIWWDTLTGLTDVPRLGADSPPPDRLRDTAVPGWADVGWRQIAAQGLHIEDDTRLSNLTAAMLDRHTVDWLVFHDDAVSDVDLAVAAVADRCEYPKNAAAHTNRAYTVALQWLAADPTIYSYVATVLTEDTPATTQTFEFENVGRWASPSGRAWTLEITAETTLQNPYVRSETTGQVVTWQGVTLTAGQTLVLDEFRASRVGSLRKDGYATTGVTKGADYPILQVGDNEFTIGGSSGTCTGVLTARSTF